MVAHGPPLPPGTEAPDFELLATPDQTLSLAEFRGRRVILAFYPEDWSPVCSDQMALYEEVLPEFRSHDAELFGISGLTKAQRAQLRRLLLILREQFTAAADTVCTAAAANTFS